MAEPERTLLVVDDEENVLETLSFTLSKDNTIRVLSAKDGEEALETLRGMKVDLVATDIRMPGMDGFDLITRIKREYPEIDFIVITGYGSPELRERANRAGALSYIEKPFSPGRFKETVDRAFAKRGQTDRKREVGFEGRMKILQLFDILQLYCLSNRTGKITIMSGRREGEIFIDRGQIVHAVSEETEGEEAVFDIIMLPGGRFSVEDGLRAPRRTIQTHWEHLLIEGTRRKDESRFAKEGMRARKKARKRKKSLPTKPAAGPLFEPGVAWLDKAFRTDGAVKGFVVFSEEGEVKSFQHADNPEHSSHLAAAIVKEGRDMAAALDLGRFRWLSVTRHFYKSVAFSFKGYMALIRLSKFSDAGAVVRKYIAKPGE